MAKQFNFFCNNYFTITAKETYFTDSIETTINLLTICDGELFFTNQIIKGYYNGEMIENVYKSFSSLSIEDLYEIGGVGFEKLNSFINNEFWKYGDCYYSSLIYSSEDKSYSALDNGDIHKFWFENGTLIKYTFENEEINSEYLISNTNTTEKIEIPYDKIKYKI